MAIIGRKPLCDRFRRPAEPLTKQELKVCNRCPSASKLKRFCCHLDFWLRPKYRPQRSRPQSNIIVPRTTSLALPESCCGEKRSRIKKSSRIALAYYRYARGYKHTLTDRWLAACRQCEHRTWLSVADYKQWFVKYRKQVVANFCELEKLAMLPKYEQSETRTLLCCRLCKCFLLAKATLEETTCLIGKWER